MLKTVALSGLAALVIAADWLRFEEPKSGGGRPFVLAALAIAPLLLRPLWLRVAGVIISIFLAACVAFSLSPLDLWPGGDGFFGPLGSQFRRGFLDFYEFRLPFAVDRHPEMHQVILVAIFGFTLAVAMAIAARRVVLAVLIFLLGAGWPATLLGGGNELGRGIVLLGVALALLAGLAERPSRLALGAAAAVLAGALALSSSPAVAKTAFLDWEQWDFYTRAEKPVNVRYVWDANYDGVRFPKKRTVVLTIRAPRRSQYWRATVLDRFDGARWLEHLWRETPRQSLRLMPPNAQDRTRWVEQHVKVGALRDDHVIGASIPVAHDIGTGVVYEGQGVGRRLGGLQRDQRYTVWSYVPRPTPEELARSRPVYPSALTAANRDLDLAPRVTLPPFGSAGRESRVVPKLTGRLQPYREVYERARAVAGETSSPYAAAVALEAWFRSTGGFTYSEQPGATPGLPPLVGFVIDTKTGYCQHFAGGMAMMLRLLGIPARVAVGFAPGRYRQGEWRVTDHDAHAWVEVWFRGYGWLPFDPTPGRARLSGTYSSTALGFNAQAAARLLADLVDGGEVFGAGSPTGIIGHDPNVRTPRSTGDFPAGIGLTPSSPPGNDAPSLLWFLFLLGAGVAAVVVLVKHGRRQLRYFTRDPRKVAKACAQELSEYLRDQRWPTAGASTLHELGATVTERAGVDASEFARAATIARYDRLERAHEAASRARSELHEVKRKLRRSITPWERARGLLSVRSLGLG